MKLTDVLVKILKKNYVKNVFGLQGGAVVHIFDSLEKNNIEVTYTNHEQSAALAAVAWAKVTNNIGCVVITTGPASTNAITGLLAAWQDSVPCIFISGQSRSQHTSYGKKVRQVGTQEVNICDVVRPLTKYTKFINNKNTFVAEFNKAISIANSGRKGPVWIDLPLEIQWSDIKFKNFKVSKSNKKKFDLKISKFKKLLENCSKPILILGFGFRFSDYAIKYLNRLILKYKIPFVTTWNGADIYPTNNYLNLGIIGMSGQRGANKAIFDADLLICLGTHLSIPHTTTLYGKYAPNAKKIIINIDKNQLDNLNVNFDLKIQSDLSFFLLNILKYNFKVKNNWQNLNFYKNQNWYEPKVTKFINSNTAIREITKRINQKKCIIIDGGGTALYAGFQSSIINKNDRVICSSAISSMGTGLAETIGVSKSYIFKKLICIIGDGSFLMNVQDLQTIYQNKINVLIILVNNNGYLAIRHTQKEFLKSRYYGTHPDWKLTMPSFKKVAMGFNIKFLTFHDLDVLKKKINTIILYKEPLICELITSPDQESLFKQGYKKSSDGTFEPQALNEMHPFLQNAISNTNN